MAHKKTSAANRGGCCYVCGGLANDAAAVQGTDAARRIADIFAVDALMLVHAEQRVEAAARLDGRVEQHDGADAGDATNHGRTGGGGGKRGDRRAGAEPALIETDADHGADRHTADGGRDGISRAVVRVDGFRFRQCRRGERRRHGERNNWKNFTHHEVPSIAATLDQCVVNARRRRCVPLRSVLKPRALQRCHWCDAPHGTATLRRSNDGANVAWDESGLRRSVPRLFRIQPVGGATSSSPNCLASGPSLVTEKAAISSTAAMHANTVVVP